MFKRLILLIVLVIFGSIGFDYAKDRLNLDVKLDEVATYIEQVTEQVANNEKIAELVTQEPLDSAIIPVDSASTAAPQGAVTTTEELANAIYYYASHYETNFTIEYKGDTSQLETMIQSAYDMLETQDPYVYGHLSDRNIEFSYTSRKATLNFNQQYLTTYEQERYVNGKVQAILGSVNYGALSDYEKVKYVNDYIVQHTAYSEATEASPHSAYAILYEGKGVCQGYALLAYKLLSEMGMEALYVTGEVYTGGHAWNLVKVDGEWYHLDTTWNDPVPDRGAGVRYDYFLINDSQMASDHSWNSTKYPQAVSTVYK